MSEDQQLIELTISNFLKTNDAAARQYQMHRRNVLEISQLVQREMASSGEISHTTKQRLQQAKFDNMKMNVSYRAHVDKLQRNLGVFEAAGEIPGLDGQIQEISRRNEAIAREAEKMTNTHKPVVEKMSRLVRNFEMAVSVKSSRASRTKTVAEKGTQDSVLVAYESNLFTREELESLFGDVSQSLANLKTVDEIDNGETGKDNAEKDNVGEKRSEPEKSQSIDVSKHLGEHLQNNRAYTRLEDGQYKYDISKSTSVDIGNATMSLSEYARAIDLLVRDIQDLVVRGTEAKERWVLNARKIELMQSLLDDAMD